MSSSTLDAAFEGSARGGSCSLEAAAAPSPDAGPASTPLDAVPNSSRGDGSLIVGSQHASLGAARDNTSVFSSGGAARLMPRDTPSILATDTSPSDGSTPGRLHSVTVNPPYVHTHERQSPTLDSLHSSQPASTGVAPDVSRDVRSQPTHRTGSSCGGVCPLAGAAASSSEGASASARSACVSSAGNMPARSLGRGTMQLDAHVAAAPVRTRPRALDGAGGSPLGSSTIDSSAISHTVDSPTPGSSQGSLQGVGSPADCTGSARDVACSLATTAARPPDASLAGTSPDAVPGGSHGDGSQHTSLDAARGTMPVFPSGGAGRSVSLDPPDCSEPPSVSATDASPPQGSALGNLHSLQSASTSSVHSHAFDGACGPLGSSSASLSAPIPLDGAAGSRASPTATLRRLAVSSPGGAPGQSTGTKPPAASLDASLGSGSRSVGPQHASLCADTSPSEGSALGHQHGVCVSPQHASLRRQRPRSPATLHGAPRRRSAFPDAVHNSSCGSALDASALGGLHGADPQPTSLGAVVASPCGISSQASLEGAVAFSSGGECSGKAINSQRRDSASVSSVHHRTDLPSASADDAACIARPPGLHRVRPAAASLEGASRGDAFSAASSAPHGLALPGSLFDADRAAAVLNASRERQLLEEKWAARRASAPRAGTTAACHSSVSCSTACAVPALDASVPAQRERERAQAAQRQQCARLAQDQLQARTEAARTRESESSVCTAATEAQCACQRVQAAQRRERDASHSCELESSARAAAAAARRERERVQAVQLEAAHKINATNVAVDSLATAARARMREIADESAAAYVLRPEIMRRIGHTALSYYASRTPLIHPCSSLRVFAVTDTFHVGPIHIIAWQHGRGYAWEPCGAMVANIALELEVVHRHLTLSQQRRDDAERSYDDLLHCVPPGSAIGRELAHLRACIR